METKKSVSKKAVWLALAGVCLGWGGTYLANHYMLAEFPAFILNGLRNFLAGLILYVFQRLRGTAPPTRAMWKSALWVGFVMFCFGSGLNVWAQKTVPTGISSLLIGSTPLWMVIIEIVISKKTKTPGPGAFAVLGVLTGFAGIILLVGPVNIMGKPMDLNPFGASALLIGSFFWSAGSLKSRTANLPPSRIMGSGMLMLTGGLSLILAGILMGELPQLSWDRAAPSAVWGFVYSVFGSSLFAFALYTWLLTAAPVTFVSTYAYISPIVALVLGALVLDEEISLRLVIASVMIIAAVAVVSVASGMKPKNLSGAHTHSAEEKREDSP